MLTEKFLSHRAAQPTKTEYHALGAAIWKIREIPAGQIVVHQGETIDFSTLLLRGFMTRHLDAPDGRRHLVGLHVPGDFVDLHSYALKRLDHDIGALTDVTVAVVTHAALERMQSEGASWTHRLWFSTSLDAAMHRQWTFRLASLNALQRVAHFLCETNARLIAVGLSDGQRFALPMTQADIGEVCGLTNVHVNRVLRQLRETGMCQVRASHVDILDLQRLVGAGVFQADYLYLDGDTARRAMGTEGVLHG